MKNEKFIKESGQESPDAKENLESRKKEFKFRLEAARSILGRAYVWERILEFDEAIKEKYPEDYTNYYALQVLIGSGGEGTISGTTEFTEFDFPEKEVEKFIDQLEEEAWLKSQE